MNKYARYKINDDEFRKLYAAGVPQSAIANHYSATINAVVAKARKMGFGPRSMGMKPQEAHVPTVQEVLNA